MTDKAWVFVVVPVVSAFIGWFTNWAAVKMIFHPRVPIGIGPLRWQGIIYRLAPKMAAEIGSTTGLVFSPEELLARLDIEALMARVSGEFPSEIESVMSEALESLAPGSWDAMAPEAREQVMAMVLSEGGRIASVVLADLEAHADSLIEIDRLFVENLSGDNADQLAAVAEEVGAKELRFIEIYGGVFGGIVGVVQAVAYGWLDRWWMMPIIGAVVGMGTNWLALQMIFRPLEPTRYLGLVTYQGMFPKRQHEIARDYGRIASEVVLTPANLIAHLSANPVTAVVGADVTAKVRQEIEPMRAMVGMLTGREPTEEQFDKATNVVVQRLADLLPAARPVVEEHLFSSLRIGDLIEDRLSELDKQQFERLLRGIFEEDEIILVIVGALLGGAVGAIQGGVVLAAGW